MDDLILIINGRRIKKFPNGKMIMNWMRADRSW